MIPALYYQGQIREMVLSYYIEKTKIAFMGIIMDKTKFKEPSEDVTIKGEAKLYHNTLVDYVQ